MVLKNFSVAKLWIMEICAKKKRRNGVLIYRLVRETPDSCVLSGCVAHPFAQFPLNFFDCRDGSFHLFRVEFLQIVLRDS